MLEGVVLEFKIKSAGRIKITKAWRAGGNVNGQGAPLVDALWQSLAYNQSHGIRASLVYVCKIPGYCRCCQHRLREYLSGRIDSVSPFVLKKLVPTTS